MFRKVLVANRGEIAVRVMRACEELNVGTVAIYSDADSTAGHVRYADEAYNVGPARAAESYLDHDAVLDVARRADVDAIHPGYGFLAENAAFASKVEDCDGITWIGPSSDAMEALGEKTNARQIMSAADVPIVPGTTDPVTDAQEVRDFGEEHGYPIAIKAEGGGGGRGMKVLESPDQIEDKLASAKREGEAYFGNDAVYLERYLKNPRHVEVQIIADEHGNVRHLGERDCSLQRRYQKVIEEAPSPALDDDVRERLWEAARRGVAEAGYVNAGTVEFLVVDRTDDSAIAGGDVESDASGDGSDSAETSDATEATDDSIVSDASTADDWEIYFLEVNTRIQVEHPVTEAITGIDLVKWQLRVAAGDELSFSQEDVTFDGHAMEFRINAENAAENFQPTAGGVLETYDPPGGIGVRVDDAIRQGDEIVTDYDSMIAKLIVHAQDREECISRSIRALREYDLDGVVTIIPFHRLMLTDESFITGEHTTAYLDSTLDHDRIEQAQKQWGTADSIPAESESSVVEREFTVEVNGKRFEVALEEHGGPLERDEQRSESVAGPRETVQTSETEASDQSVVDGDGERIEAEMQGTILSVDVEEGDDVDAGDVLVVLEAMKMENDIVASRGGTVTHVAVSSGETVDMGDTLIVLD